MAMHAVVTGADKGIGLELYRQLANNSKDYQQIFAICRKTSAELTSLATESHSRVQIVSGIGIMQDDAPTKLQQFFRTNNDKTVPIHLFDPQRWRVWTDRSLCKSQKYVRFSNVFKHLTDTHVV
jgi:NAD(P)-dependent dehydrogenase (short-subunit alcohol dehydrogenase family)